ncbi:hypothetical protein RB595_001671 [Gaeumannomyces hyphopodioides]
MDQGAKTLADWHREAEAGRLALEGAYEASGAARRAQLDVAIEAYRQALALIDRASVFSPNETLEDVRTDHMPYMLVEHHLANLAQKVPTEGPAARRAVLQESRARHERFLHLLDSYGALGAPQQRLLRDYDDSPASFSTLPADPARRRDAKIAAFRREKELRAKLEALKARAARTKLRGAAAATATTSTSEGDDEGNDDGGGGNALEEAEAEDAAEEWIRPARLTQLEMAADEALQALEGINREEEVLAQAPEPFLPPTGASVEDDERRRRAAADQDSHQTSRVDLHRLQSILGGGGPLLDKGGRPLQPFTIVGNRAELAKGVFRPGHNLPTMSIDEYLDEERRRGGIIEGGGEASGIIPEPDEDNIEKADAEMYKARAWDEYVEANPRGSGNTLNRG